MNGVGRQCVMCLAFCGVVSKNVLATFLLFCFLFPAQPGTAVMEVGGLLISGDP